MNAWYVCRMCFIAYQGDRCPRERCRHWAQDITTRYESYPFPTEGVVRIPPAPRDFII